MNLKLHTKTLLALGGVVIVLMLITALASLLSFRDFSIRSATEHTRTAAETIRVALTEAMLNGTIHQRDGLLNRVAQINGLKEARVIRGKQVNEQFGEGLAIEAVSDELDLQVLRSGKPVFKLVGGFFSSEFRATIPYIADSQGDVNCLSCHAVENGSVLGAVSLTASIAHMRKAALVTNLVLITAIAAFAVLILIFMRRLLKPLVTTANEIEHAVRQANKGDFSVRVEQRSQDEIGAIAKHFNSMSEGITEKLTGIRHNVARLIKSQPNPNVDLLTDTANTVTGLVKISQFKQAIEEDETSEEVYQRISEVLADEFDIHKFSIYTVNNTKKTIAATLVDAIPEENFKWCDKAVLENCTSCRAVRTGHNIDGRENNLICRSFSTSARDEGLRYYCFPINHAGSVGSVVQLIFEQEEIEKFIENKPLIASYLREATPVLQAKNLMASLKESTLNDAMTGLRNRRFLEEYSETLVAQCKRRGTSMTLVMMDLDYFKKVNDTYGHDVGDDILIDLANIIRANVRDSDLVIRYGGEEFLVILPDTPADDGVKVAEKIRQAVENYQFNAGGVLINKTISAGLADYPSDGQAFWQALKYADVALYAAKDAGRNQVVKFTPDLWVSEEKY